MSRIFPIKDHRRQYLMMLVMLISLMPQAVMAAGPVSIDLSTVTSDGTGYTCSSSIVNSVTEYVVTITDSGTYILTSTVNQTTHPTHVIVAATTANITLSGVNLSLVNFF